MTHGESLGDFLIVFLITYKLQIMLACKQSVGVCVYGINLMKLNECCGNHELVLPVPVSQTWLLPCTTVV